MTTSDEPIPSPCIRNCCLNEEDVCLGCFRSLKEIVGWADTDNASRQIILANTKNRRVAYHQKHKQLPE
ncbi:MAG: DUF1289 domain-containing protein [Methyloglobulus sp.]